MEYIKLGHSGLEVSRLCLGTMNMGCPSWKPWIFNEQDSEPIVLAALDAGINFIDLADFYSSGQNEVVLGNILRRHAKREELVITSKVGYPLGQGRNNHGLSRKHIFDSIEGSLKRLGSDYLDIYMLHFFDVNTPVEETMQALDDIVRSGKARYIGVSTMKVGELAKILQVCDRYNLTRPINMQLQLNCAYRENERDMIPFCRDQGLGVSVFSPLARGILSGDFTSKRNKTDFFTSEMYDDACSYEVAASVQRVASKRGVSCAQIAQAWVLNRPGVRSVLVGADNPAQFKSAISALETKLTEEELYELDRNYVPCDLIDDYNLNRIPRIARPPKGAFAAIIQKEDLTRSTSMNLVS